MKYYKGPLSDHFDGTCFFNPWNPHSTSFWKVLQWKLTSKRRAWPTDLVEHAFDTPPTRVEGKLLRVSFVGHATTLIQTGGLNILTDPIWSERASPFKLFGPARYTAPGIPFEKLPKIDIVLISHNHYDHLDLPTLHKIWERDRPKIIAPLGNDAIIHAKYPFISVQTLDWMEKFSLQNAEIYLLPAQHWSARGYFDRNKALWGAFVIATPSGNIYFAGDSGYGTGTTFKDAYQQFRPFRLALLPIGAYEPRWFMNYAHMNPEDALKAHTDLGAPPTVAIHFETFRLSDEGFNDPRQCLAHALAKQGADASHFCALQVGESWMVPLNQPSSR